MVTLSLLVAGTLALSQAEYDALPFCDELPAIANVTTPATTTPAIAKATTTIIALTQTKATTTQTTLAATSSHVSQSDNYHPYAPIQSARVSNQQYSKNGPVSSASTPESILGLIGLIAYLV
jgi:hypothetical protein